jgi:hypothetical protein
MRRVCSFLCVAALVVFPAGAAAAVEPRSAGFEVGTFDELSQTNVDDGALGLTTDRAFDGGISAHASYGGGGEDGHARGLWNVDWSDGEEVWFGAAYYLPPGFHSKVQGQVDLLRWDNWPSRPTGTDSGGVSISGSDRRARLLRFGAGRPKDTLVGPIALPEGRWFTLEVHQRLSDGAGALSELYLDGVLVGSSTRPNTYGRPIERLRYGLVAIASDSQQKPLELWFDRATVGPRRAGGGTPAPTPEPVFAESRLADFEADAFDEFSQTNVDDGALGLTRDRAFEGGISAHASYGGGGDNGYARGLWDVRWENGEEVWFGAAFYLPPGFHSSIQGQVDLVRWDNWASHPSDTDWGGVSIYGSDRRARLLRFGAGRSNDTLVGPLELPEGRWFTLEVHQRLSDGAGALSELYLDGALVGSSTKPNTYGRSIERVRYGIVAIASDSQQKPLELWFDRATAARALE